MQCIIGVKDIGIRPTTTSQSYWCLNRFVSILVLLNKCQSWLPSMNKIPYCCQISIIYSLLLCIHPLHWTRSPNTSAILYESSKMTVNQEFNARCQITPWRRWEEWKQQQQRQEQQQQNQAEDEEAENASNLMGLEDRHPPPPPLFIPQRGGTAQRVVF